MALDIRILNHNMEEIDLDATEDDDDDTISEEIVGTMEDADGFSDSLDESDLDEANMLLEDDDDYDYDLDEDLDGEDDDYADDIDLI